MIAIIVAYSKNRAIGKNNDLPWHLPADLKHFKSLTVGHPVIMGRNTFESIYARLGKALPDRRNIVVSSKLRANYENVEVVASLQEALSKVGQDDAFIIGGAQLYGFSLENNLVDKIYATEVDKHIDGDAFFPELSSNQWREVSREKHSDEDQLMKYDFVEYIKEAD